MNQIEVKACPFCGKDNESNGMRTYIRHRERADGDQSYWNMHCPEVAGGCGAEIHGDTKEEAIIKWNTRI